MPEFPGFHEHVIQQLAEHRETDPGELADPWEDPYCSRIVRLDEKVVVKSFIDGIILAQRWGSEMFRHPPGLQEVLGDVGKDIQTLRFGFADGRIMLSIREMVNVHMRRWVGDSKHIQDWIKSENMTSRNILRNACEEMVLYQQIFDLRYKEFSREYQRESKYEVKTKKSARQKAVFRPVLEIIPI